MLATSHPDESVSFKHLVETVNQNVWLLQRRIQVPHISNWITTLSEQQVCQLMESARGGWWIINTDVYTL